VDMIARVWLISFVWVSMCVSVLAGEKSRERCERMSHMNYRIHV